MRYTLTICLLSAAVLLSFPELSAATLRDRIIQRRQSEEAAPESTTAASQQAPNPANQQPPQRLYPDLPREAYPHHYPPNHGPTPFVPFGISMPTNRLGDPMQPWPPLQQPRPKSPAERAQSLAFTSGLGQRLLAMIGIEPPPANNQTSQVEGAAGNPRLSTEQTMKALQNATILQQLNKGVHSIYSSVSKLYNSTVQEQLNVLQERFQRETANSTNQWQQRMAQQVPEFFKSVAAKVADAQENLNRAWRQLAQANNASLTDRSGMSPSSQQQQGPPPRNFFSAFDQFMGNQQPNGPDGAVQPGNFFSQLGRTFGMNGNPNDPNNRDLGSQLMDIWHHQVQPQIGSIRNQVARVWRDLTSSGVYIPEQPVLRNRASGNNLGSAPSDSALPEVVEDVLKEVDMNSPEYTLIDSQDNQQMAGRPSLTSHIQQRLIHAQRDLNQLWAGLTKSLQNAISNVQAAMNPKTLEASAATDEKKEVDPEENKIDGTIKDLSKLQREADSVYDVVQQQQNQRQGLGDRFKNFFNNMDFIDIDRVGNQVSRFGTAVGDLWNQIPRRWDDFVQNARPQMQQMNGRLVASSSTTTQKPEAAAAQAN